MLQEKVKIRTLPKCRHSRDGPQISRLLRGIPKRHLTVTKGPLSSFCFNFKYFIYFLQISRPVLDHFSICSLKPLLLFSPGSIFYDSRLLLHRGRENRTLMIQFCTIACSCLFKVIFITQIKSSLNQHNLCLGDDAHMETELQV